MNLKNINNYFLLFFLIFFFVSCSNNNSISIKTQIEEIEDKDIISNINFIQQEDFNDYYYRNSNFKWKQSTILNKSFTLKIGKNLNSNLNVSNIIIDQEYIYFINDDLNFISVSLFDGNQDNEILLDLPIDIQCAQHLEGGPEASLYLKSNNIELIYSGSYESNFFENNNNSMLWEIPNIIGITKK